MTSTRDKLLSLNVVEAKQPTNKVSVVGVGEWGHLFIFDHNFLFNFQNFPLKNV
jgi:hypothetical protein